MRWSQVKVVLCDHVANLGYVERLLQAEVRLRMMLRLFSSRRHQCTLRQLTGAVAGSRCRRICRPPMGARLC